MKKILVVLSLICFVAVNISVAQTAPTAKQSKTEAVAKTDAKTSATPACCKGKSVKDCSAAQMKNCTPEQKAACMKACSHGDKAKADATPAKKDGAKANNN